VKTLIQRTGVLVIGIVLLSAAIPSTQATEEQNPKSVYENAASEYRIAVMQIFKRHMLALDIAANVDSPLDYNLVIHARALRETARMLEEIPVPKPVYREKAKYKIVDQRDFIELVTKGINAADEVYVGARLIRFEGRNRFDKALVVMKGICSECHKTFLDPFRTVLK